MRGWVGEREGGRVQAGSGAVGYVEPRSKCGEGIGLTIRHVLKESLTRVGSVRQAAALRARCSGHPCLYICIHGYIYIYTHTMHKTVVGFHSQHGVQCQHFDVFCFAFFFLIEMHSWSAAGGSLYFCLSLSLLPCTNFNGMEINSSRCLVTFGSFAMIQLSSLHFGFPRKNPQTPHFSVD